jgi:dTDP-4-dehydrorhamnose 3,5-epimerase
MSPEVSLTDGVKIAGEDKIIEGVKVVPLRRIPDERGTIYHMLKRTDPHFIQFGEIYFSTVYPGVVKGWHKHREMTLNYACVFGRVKVVLYDDRENSPTRGELMEIFLGPDNYSLVIIPPELWNGFKGMSEPYAIVANCCTHPHDPSLSTRLDPFKNHIPYDWAVKHC